MDIQLTVNQPSSDNVGSTPTTAIMTIKTLTINNRFAEHPFDISLGEDIWCEPPRQSPHAMYVIAIIATPHGYQFFGRVPGGYAAVSWKDVTKNFPKTLDKPNDEE